jgi:2-polyprenyl-3-methyl-5-hydroxy-6-metoxy-1,4-benzoquinol methylase
MTSIEFRDVIKAWDRDGEAGGHGIHPLPVDSAEWWALGEAQAAQVDEYAEAGDLVIDFGCGYGRLSIPLARAGYDVLAVDASQAMLDGLDDRAKRAGQHIDALLSDGTELLDIVDHAIGRRAAVVISRAVLIHHSYADIERLVTIMASVLRPGGILIADWPTAAAPRERTNWTDVTTWHPHHRALVAARASLEPVDGTHVWRKMP